MRRFWATDRRRATRASASAPSVRFVYDRPLPYARIMRIEILDPDGSVVSSMTRSFQPRTGWVTESVADCA